MKENQNNSETGVREEQLCRINRNDSGRWMNILNPSSIPTKTHRVMRTENLRINS